MLQWRNSAEISFRGYVQVVESVLSSLREKSLMQTKTLNVLCLNAAYSSKSLYPCPVFTNIYHFTNFCVNAGIFSTTLCVIPEHR